MSGLASQTRGLNPAQILGGERAGFYFWERRKFLTAEDAKFSQSVEG
jgi:hypothetical protein